MSDLYQDPEWPRAGSWLHGEISGGTLGRLAVLGVPANQGSITPGRCDLAPAAIRAALNRFSTYDLEHHRNLLDLSVSDLGDLDIAGKRPEDAFDSIRQATNKAASQANAVVLLGGDNSVTYPGVIALDECGLITFDAHLDLRSLHRGLSNGNPLRALLARGFPGHRIVQIGIQSFANSEPYMRVAKEASIRVITADEVRRKGIETIVGEALDLIKANAIYVDLDLDVLDRAFAPATPGSRPGGLTPSDVRIAARLCGEDPRVRVLDIVEMDPTQDVADQTALAAAACFLSFASGVHRRCSLSQAVRNS